MSDLDDNSGVVVGKETCSKCGEPNAMVRYADGHVHCFNPACGWHTKGTGSVSAPKPKKLASAVSISTDIHIGRGIDIKTMARYGYGSSNYGKDAKAVHAWTIYGQDGQAAFNKLRFLDKKDFVSLPIADSADGPNECQLWGMHVWGDQHDKRVVVTEGEIDAMSVAQASDFKYPVVSVNGGAASAARGLKANYRWLDQFNEIILWFDQDEAGLAAMAECAPLFASGKVKIAKIEGFKDANAALVAKKRAELELAVYGAMLWAPAGIVNAADRLSDLADGSVRPMWAFPYELPQALTGGCRRGEIYYHVAGTGSGKTTILNEYAYHWLFGEGHTEVPAKIGVLAFETLIRETMLGIMSIGASQRLHLDPLPDKELAALHQQVFGTRRVEMFDPEKAEWGFEPLVRYIYYMVKALDCNIIMVDPLSFVAAQLDERDERKALDMVAVKFAKAAKELGVAIHISHHLTRPEGVGHEEGGMISVKQVRGSGGIIMFANGAIGYERNQQAEGSARLVTTMRSLKWRWTGYTGILGYTLYDEETGRTEDLDPSAAAKLLSGKDDEPEAHFKPITPDSEY